MELKEKIADRQFDSLIQNLVCNRTLIINATTKLGIPISESIAYASRHFERQRHIEKLQDSIDATTDDQ